MQFGAYGYDFEFEIFQTLVVITVFETSVQLHIGYGYEPKSQLSHAAPVPVLRPHADKLVYDLLFPVAVLHQLTLCSFC